METSAVNTLNGSLSNGACTALTNLASFLSHHSDTAILRHFLGFLLPDAPSLLNSAIVLGLDTVRWENKPHPITEIGIAEWDGFINPGKDVGTHCENALINIRAAHMRLKLHAHLLNKQAGAGDPENFIFGKTVFVDEDTAKQALAVVFKRRDFENGPLVPVILIGHGIAADIANLKETLGVDVLAYHSIVKIIDTQALASTIPSLSYSRTAGHNATTISLQMLLAHFGIPIEAFNTAGNDVTYTLILAILLCYNDQSTAVPRPTQNNVHISTVIRNLKTVCSEQEALPFGDEKWCTRCSGVGHFRKECRTDLSCEYCVTSSSPKAQQTAYTHMVEKCLFKANLVGSPRPNSEGGSENGYGGTGHGGGRRAGGFPGGQGRIGERSIDYSGFGGEAYGNSGFQQRGGGYPAQANFASRGGYGDYGGFGHVAFSGGGGRGGRGRGRGRGGNGVSDYGGGGWA